jgi:hypothetical protein
MVEIEPQKSKILNIFKVGSPKRKSVKQGESDTKWGKNMVRPEPCSLHGYSRRMGKYTLKGVPGSSLRAASGCKMEVWGRTNCTTSAAAFAAPR